MRILFATSEAQPFAASGGLADVSGALPKALRKRLIGCRVVMPLYDIISAEMREKMTFIGSISVPVSWRRQYCGIFEAKSDGVIYYLLDNQYYFKRGTLYGHYDDAERFAFFSRAVLEILPHINFKPDVIHCNDWQTAMTPVFLDRYYVHDPFYTDIKTVFTIHNIQYQGVYGKELIDNVIGLDYSHKNLIEYDDTVNFAKAAIECANAVSTVSPSYAKEILDPWYSHGLDTILKERSFKLRGILNGIDVENYNPETDKDIFKNYSAEKMTGKATNKRELQKFFGLPEKKDTPVMGMVTRLVSHKGLDLCKAVLDELLATTDIQLVVLGSGDTEYEDFFRGLASRYPEQVGLCLGFIPDLARKIYAGTDLFLMPSKSEPCGLSQMVALRYGSIPIVRETGGLRDSVKDSGDGEGNGFTFANYNAHEMLHSIRRACEGYSDKKGWKILVKRAMESDNSWGKSANEYIRMYKEILKG